MRLFLGSDLDIKKLDFFNPAHLRPLRYVINVTSPSGASDRKVVWVQVPSPAPVHSVHHAMPLFGSFQKAAAFV